MGFFLQEIFWWIFWAFFLGKNRSRNPSKLSRSIFGTTGGPYDGNDFMEEVPCRTSRDPLRPLVVYFFYLVLGLGNKRAFSLSEATWDHFCCTVEPSPGHIRCRNQRFAFKGEDKNPKDCEAPKVLQDPKP